MCFVLGFGWKRPDLKQYRISVLTGYRLDSRSIKEGSRGSRFTYFKERSNHCTFAFVFLGSCLALLFVSFGACGSVCIKLFVIETLVALASSVEVSMWEICRHF